VGYQLATRVQMTQMPELVAIMHSLVGLAAVFVGFNAHIEIGRARPAIHARRGCPSRKPEGRMSEAAYTLLGRLSRAFGELIGKKTGSRSASCGSSWSSASGSAR
jgi:NAD(P) transhydrogenase subunit beta